MCDYKAFKAHPIAYVPMADRRSNRTCQRAGRTKNLSPRRPATRPALQPLYCTTHYVCTVHHHREQGSYLRVHCPSIATRNQISFCSPENISEGHNPFPQWSINYPQSKKISHDSLSTKTPLSFHWATHSTKEGACIQFVFNTPCIRPTGPSYAIASLSSFPTPLNFLHAFPDLFLSCLSTHNQNQLPLLSTFLSF